MAHVRRNMILAGLGIAVFGGLLFVTYRPEPVPVDLHAVSRDTFEITVDVDGETRVVDLYEVSAPISGLALRSPVEVGDPVVAGETVVAQVEPASPALLDARTRLQAEAHVREMEAALNLAEADRTKAAEDLEYAQTQFERVTRLVERNVSSVTQLETAEQQRTIAEAALVAAEARIGQSRSGLDAARAALVETTSDEVASACCATILAPANGVVLDIDMVSARPVIAGTRLLSVGNPRALEIVADILSVDAVRLPSAAEARVERWGGAPLEARLTRIEPAARTKVSALGIEEQRVDAVFEIVSPPEARENLGHGFAVFLRIIEHREDNVLTVPLSSVFRAGDDWAVFRTAGDRVERVLVDVGRRNGRYAVILSGLNEDDLVVEHPSADLTDGDLFVERAAFAND